MFSGIWGFCGISCFLGDLVLLRVVGGPRAHRGRAMASRLARTRLYLFPLSSETLFPPLGDSAPALPNWQRLVPIPHDSKYMRPGKVAQNPRLRFTLLTRLRPFDKWSKNLTGLGLFGNTGNSYTIPNCLMSSKGQWANRVDTTESHFSTTRFRHSGFGVQIRIDAS